MTIPKSTTTAQKVKLWLKENQIGHAVAINAAKVVIHLNFCTYLPDALDCAESLVEEPNYLNLKQAFVAAREAVLAAREGSDQTGYPFKEQSDAAMSVAWAIETTAAWAAGKEKAAAELAEETLWSAYDAAENYPELLEKLDELIEPLLTTIKA